MGKLTSGIGVLNAATGEVRWELPLSGGLVDPTWQRVDPGTAAAWVATGFMTEERADQTATLLPDGKVLVAGGEAARHIDGDWTTPSSSELLNSATGTWSATGDMTVARPRGHTATLLADGRVLVVGGAAINEPIPSAELYAPGTGTWTATAPMVEVHGRGHTATLLPDGRVLVVGGDQAGTKQAGAELYDPATGSWSATGEMIVRRWYHTATLLPDGRVLVAGTVRRNGMTISEDENPQSAELYDPDTGTWSATGRLTDRRYDFAAESCSMTARCWSGQLSPRALSCTIRAPAYGRRPGHWRSDAPAAIARPCCPTGPCWYSVGLVGCRALDPTGTWAAAPDVGSPRGGTTTLLADGTVLVAGDGSASAVLYKPGRAD